MIVLFMSVAESRSFAVTETMIGDALDSDHSLFCRERYTFDWSQLNKELNSIKIEYLNKDNKILAEITSDFKNNLQIPKTHFLDLRDSYEYEFAFDSSTKAILSWVKENAQSLKKNKTIHDVDENSYVFSSLIFYIQQHLDELDHDKEFTKKLFSPSKQEIYDIEFKKTTNTSKRSPDAISIAIKMKSFFLRALMPEIILCFDRQTKRLISFDGNDNLLDEHDKAHKVHIDFSISK